MKKLLALGLMLVMTISMALTVAAAPGAFIQSPSNNGAPTIIEFESENGYCGGTVIITPFNDRNTLDPDRLENIQDAYDSIFNSNGVSTIVPDIDIIAEQLNVNVNGLAISDLFEIGLDSCDKHDEHGNFYIKLDSETLEHFVALIYFENGEWHILDGATITEDGYLKFKTEVPRTFAIVVDAENIEIDVPQTGDMIPWILIGVIALSATGIVVLSLKSRKSNKA